MIIPDPAWLRHVRHLLEAGEELDLESGRVMLEALDMRATQIRQAEHYLDRVVHLGKCIDSEIFGEDTDGE